MSNIYKMQNATMSMEVKQYVQNIFLSGYNFQKKGKMLNTTNDQATQFKEVVQMWEREKETDSNGQE
jgi:hypothetical protein